MADTYVYSPLDLSKDSIRLLRLCKGNPGTEIRCELLESFLSESEGVPYEALSYTWGGELTSNSPRVLLDGVEVPITENLFEALHSLRLGSLDC
ncbi:HET-domain-containing protein [Apiospora marii]|uniref:HET-domain-containing protein n=1 Tax=Apiospora marii TaxID=335849 RepID=UPI00312D077E